jgi:hypothetical protein
MGMWGFLVFLCPKLGCFGFSRSVHFTMHLDTMYI